MLFDIYTEIEPEFEFIDVNKLEKNQSQLNEVKENDPLKTAESINSSTTEKYEIPEPALVIDVDFVSQMSVG